MFFFWASCLKSLAVSTLMVYVTRSRAICISLHKYRQFSEIAKGLQEFHQIVAQFILTAKVEGALGKKQIQDVASISGNFLMASANVVETAMARWVFEQY